MKTCPKCGEQKEASAFTKDLSQADGLDLDCRQCTRECSRLRRAKELQAMKEQNLAAKINAPVLFCPPLSSFVSPSVQDRPAPYMNSGYYPSGTDLRYVNIPHEEERRLFAAARAGDTDAKEFLIKNHLLFALNQGRAWSRGKLPEDEVASAANYALVTSFDRFDPSRENRFAAFLRPAIRGAIARLWRSKTAVDMPEFPDKEGASGGVQEDEFVFVDHPVEADDHAAYLRQTLEVAKGVLTEREAEIVGLLFQEGPLDMAEIAKLKGVTRERIRQIKEVALMKLRREMKRRMEAAGELP